MWRKTFTIVLMAIVFSTPLYRPASLQGVEPAANAPNLKIDLNTATFEALRKLPGVDEETATKIIAGRPYKSINDLHQAGVSLETIETLKDRAWVVIPPRATPIQVETTDHRLDLNKATAAQLQQLPGIGETRVRKIIAGRPYQTIDDLERAGLSIAAIEVIRDKVTVGSRTTTFPARLAKLNLNSATPEQFQELAGVSDATARKIIAGRPYSSVDDLAKAGMSKSDIDKVRDDVTVRAVSPIKDVGAVQVVDLNTASREQLEDLRGVGSVTAEKIIAGRPYRSVDDLTKAGVSIGTVDKIRGSVTVTSRDKVRFGKTLIGEPIGANSKESEQPVSMVLTKKPPHPGMVWVNPDTGTYHKEGSRWYGRTKDGKFMTEGDAKRANYIEAKH